MKLIQVFVPLSDNDGNCFPNDYFRELTSTLNEKFGGVTIYKRMPVEGFWKEAEERTEKDELAIFEVLADTMDGDYWKQLKLHLETKFRQKDMLIRYWEVATI